MGALNILRKVWPILVIAVVFIVGAILLDRYDKAQQKVGEQRTVISQQGETLNEIQSANKAANRVLDASDVAAFCECLRTARTSGDCERFLPVSEANYSSPVSLCKE